MANQSLRASIIYRRPLLPAPTLRALAQRYPSQVPGSLRAILGQAGPFQANADLIRINPQDAFVFLNKDWSITEEDAGVLRERFQREVDFVKTGALALLHDRLSTIPVDVPLVPTFNLPSIVVAEVIRRVTGDLTDAILDKIVSGFPGDYGRCGGMAFAGLDYFLIGQNIPEDTQPPASGPLRKYIWQRLLDSLELNVARFLEWVVQLHILPVISKTASGLIGAVGGAVVGGPIGAAIGAFMAGKGDIIGLGGADVLVERTRGELNNLRGRLIDGPAWPIGLIYDDSALVWEQHQMLALRFQDLAGGKLMLTVWDNNDGRQETQWVVDASGEQLQVTGGGERDQFIKGIICEEYHLACPPLCPPTTG